MKLLTKIANFIRTLLSIDPDNYGKRKYRAERDNYKKYK